MSSGDVASIVKATQTKTIERDIESPSLYGNLALLFKDIMQVINARPSPSRVNIKLTEWKEDGYKLVINLFGAESEGATAQAVSRQGKEIVTCPAKM